MAENVLILGAGFSCDAGIPLMGSFVERMWEIARRGKDPIDGKALRPSDLQLLVDATGLIDELDTYHGRANFDDRNIEDILSILSFKAMGRGRGSRASLEKMSQAIATTIELTCRVRRRDLIANPNCERSDAAGLYRGFWRALLAIYKRSRDFPAIITFNYDLVLERSLVELLTGTDYNQHDETKRLPLPAFQLNYFNSKAPSTAIYKATPALYDVDWRTSARAHGYKLMPVASFEGALQLKLLKLHGSLNFPKSGKHKTIDLEAAVDDPQILPPLFNKDTAVLGSGMWAEALKELGSAKNIVVVGYSLPRTDIYMQYFLRAALGPNRELNKITVYDPTLFSDGAAGEALRGRYQECFSPQLQRRIDFSPPLQERVAGGTARHFVHDLASHPERLFFL